MANLLKIGGLWKGTDKNGNEMLSGKLEIPVGVTVDDTTRVVALTNIHKDADNHPDFQLYFGKDEPQGQ